MINLISAAAVAWAGDVAADAAAPGIGGGLNSSILSIIAIFAVMYFLLIRPQSKKAKEHQAMLKSVQKGDRIWTTGGIHAKVTAVNEKDGDLTVEIAPEVRVKLSRSAVAAKDTRGAAPAPAPQTEKK